MDFKKLRSEVIWTTRDSEEILLKRMEDSHIKNTIVFLTKQQEKYSELNLGTYQVNDKSAKVWIEMLTDELSYRKNPKVFEEQVSYKTTPTLEKVPVEHKNQPITL